MSSAAEVSGSMRRLALTLYPAVVEVVTRHGGLLETRIKSNASGRPGPNAPTGDYRASWTMEGPVQRGTSVTATVGTDRPQARRLEWGFVGADILGRVFNQAPYPHVDPAVQAQGEAFRADFERTVRGLE